MNLLEKFNEVTILVVGDIMIDRYWRGSINRISPEAPVPIVNLHETRVAAGGAANVAANIAGLGAKVYLIGITGEDEDATLLKQILTKLSISSDFLVSLPNRRTTVKTRVVAHQQHVVRLDQESTVPINSEQEEKVWQQIERVFDEIDLVVVSDYAKGLLTPNLLSRLIKFSEFNLKKIVIDPKGKDYFRYKGATLLTPNKREAADACNIEESGENIVEKLGEILLMQNDLKALLITQGEEGMTLFQNNEPSYHLPVQCREVYDVTGAGDTVVATLAVALGAGAELKTAAELANNAAGIVIEHFGTTTIKIQELKKITKI